MNSNKIFLLKNGKGFIKEFDDNNYLIFEGEYLNGERNGKGKEYNGELIFEGEYLNGKRWNGNIYQLKQTKIYPLVNGKGYADIFWYYGKLFEDEYLNGEIKKRKKYTATGELDFECEFLNGKKNGKGKEYDFYGKLVFEGEYLNGERNGKGKEYYSDGKLKFEGEYLNGDKWRKKWKM